MNFLKKIKSLTSYHEKKCPKYKKIINTIFKNINAKTKLGEMPFLPVNVFKELELMSINKKNIYKIMKSSGTGGRNSKIFLNKENAKKQIETLNKIFRENVHHQRLPMIVFGPNPNKVFNKNEFNAQVAAILGFSIFSKKNIYLLDENNNFDLVKLKNTLKEIKNEKFYLFGFTFNIYKFLIEKKIKKINLKNGILIHGGGWKKMEPLKINNSKFKSLLYRNYKLKRVINYYGLIEQTGSIFFECESCNRFVNSEYNNIYIRDKNLNILKNKKKGIIQLISTLPTSYPGHNILTEDLGEVCGENNCPCGRRGKYFLVHGRIQKSQIRGCGNV